MWTNGPSRGLWRTEAAVLSPTGLQSPATANQIVESNNVPKGGLLGHSLQEIDAAPALPDLYVIAITQGSGVD